MIEIDNNAEGKQNRNIIIILTLRYAGAIAGSFISSLIVKTGKRIRLIIGNFFILAFSILVCLLDKNRYMNMKICI